MLRMEEEEETSECSSGCQSGWTMYLDQSYENPTSLPFKKGCSHSQQEEEEQEDLSMVSDASSGPPHFHEEDDHYYSHYCCDGDGCFFSVSSPPTAPAPALAKNGGKRRRIEAEKKPQHPESSSFLDDTASSPLFSFTKTSLNLITKTHKSSVEDVLEFSYGFSATHFEGKSPLQSHQGYFQSSTPVKPTSAKP